MILCGLRESPERTGLHYYDADGKMVKSAKEAKRIRSLAIPPAWKDVWICSHPNGHLQATGLDVRGRKQYKYHPDWRAVRELKPEEAVVLSLLRGELDRRSVLKSTN
jgi:DNA topoisomerase I